MRRAGLVATLVAGVALLGASLHGMGGVDRTLRAAAAPAPQPVIEHRDCERRHERRHPEV